MSRKSLRGSLSQGAGTAAAVLHESGAAAAAADDVETALAIADMALGARPSISTRHTHLPKRRSTG